MPRPDASRGLPREHVIPGRLSVDSRPSRHGLGLAFHRSQHHLDTERPIEPGERHDADKILSFVNIQTRRYQNDGARFDEPRTETVIQQQHLVFFRLLSPERDHFSQFDGLARGTNIGLRKIFFDME
jgi:hypothetical protein